MDALREAVARSGFTKSFIAEVVGANPSQLSHWLSGARPVPEVYRPRLAALLRRDVDELFPDGRAAA